MCTLRIGIIPRDKFQKRVIDIAAGHYKPKRGEPKIWFSSIKSFSEVLSDNNIRLLRIIAEHHPETLKELAKLSGRQSSNLSRTLKTMERYGIVELRKEAKHVIPIAKATVFNIQYAAV